MFSSTRLQHFRSYKDGSFEFQPNVNIIVGPNGSGKTNLLEALLVSATGSSYRARDVDLIQFEQAWGRIDTVLSNQLERTTKLRREPPSKQYEFAGKPLRRLNFAQKLPIVLFEPDHLQLLTGSPELRRNYLDDLLEQADPSFGAIRRHYRRSLQQRNALLKHAKPSEQQ